MTDWADRLRGLIPYAAEGGRTWHTAADFAFGFFSGDPDDLCFEISDDLLEVVKYERGTTSGPLIRGTVEVVEQFLSVRYGPDVRRTRGLPEARVDTRAVSPWHSEAWDFSWDKNPDGYEVRVHNRAASAMNRVDAPNFSRYGHESGRTIRDAFRDPRGGTLLTISDP